MDTLNDRLHTVFDKALRTKVIDADDRRQLTTRLVSIIVELFGISESLQLTEDDRALDWIAETISMYRTKRVTKKLKK